MNKDGIKTYQTKPGSMIEILKIALPLVFSTASMQVMMFFNRIVISWYSSDALSAHVPAMIITFNFVCFFMGVAMYTNVFVAQYYGSKQYDFMTQALWQGFFFAVISGFLIVALIPLGIFLIQLSPHSNHIKELEIRYFTIAACGGISVVCYHALSSFFTGQGKTLVTMVITIIGNVFNIFLSYILVFGSSLLSIPSLGITGAAIALVSSNTLTVLLCLAIILNKKNRLTFRTWDKLRFDRTLFFRLLKFGLPNGVGFFLDIAAFTLFVFLNGSAGKNALAASNITLSLEGLSFMPVLGIGMATSTLVGQYIGKGDKPTAIKITYRAALLCFGYAFFISILFFTKPDFFLRFFTMGSHEDLTDIIREAYPLLRALGFFIVFDAFNVVFSNAIKGAGDTKYQMIISIIMAWFFFAPGIVLMMQYWHKPVVWGWIWATVYVFLLGLIFFLRFLSRKWEKIDLISLPKISTVS